MEPQIQFEPVQTPEQMSRLREFALTLEPAHEIQDLGNQYFIIKRGNEWIGYFEYDVTPTFHTAWKKGVTARGLRDAMINFTGYAKLSSLFHGNQPRGQVTVPLDTKTFPEAVMRRLGFIPSGNQIYHINLNA